MKREMWNENLFNGDVAVLLDGDDMVTDLLLLPLLLLLEQTKLPDQAQPALLPLLPPFSFTHVVTNQDICANSYCFINEFLCINEYIQFVEPK